MKTPFEVFSNYSEKHNSDLLYINSPMRGPIELLLSKIISSNDKKENVTLILVTEGGSADTAYKIARILQRKYKNFSIVIPGWCKSAGTLLTIGAESIFFGEMGELGPLDIQMGKKDELIGYVSGLDLQYGIDSLKNDAYDMFETIMLRTCAKSGGRVTLKTSAEIATALTKTYISRLAEQISPGERGETARLMSIAIDYGRRLNSKYENLQGDDALAQLVSGYSSHGFVIDLPEAESIFKRVSACSDDLNKVLHTLGDEGWYPPDDGVPRIAFLNKLLTLEDEDDADEEQSNDQQSAASPRKRKSEPNKKPSQVNNDEQRSKEAITPDDGAETASKKLNGKAVAPPSHG